MDKFVYKPFTFRSYTSLSPNFRLLAAPIVHMRILYYSVLDRIVILKNELKQLRVKIRYIKRHFKTLDRKRSKAKWESSLQLTATIFEHLLGSVLCILSSLVNATSQMQRQRK